MTDTLVNYNDYPLPIAHEYSEFLSVSTWDDRCLKAIDVLDVTLRYCLVIAISDYFEGSPVDPKITKWLWEQMRHPKTWELPDLLSELFAKLSQTTQTPYMPELHDFCYDANGQLSPAMRKAFRIAEELARPRSDQKYSSRVLGHEEKRLKKLYKKHISDLNEVLQALSFLRKYTLINIVSWQKNGDEIDWYVQELMGAEIPQLEEVTKWKNMGAPPINTEIALWDTDKKRVLFLLHPFALFRKVEPPMQQEATAIEELLLYERGELEFIWYYGLQETAERIPYQLQTTDMFDEFTKRTGIDPRKIWIDVSIAPLHPEGRKDWDELKGLGLRLSAKQVYDFKHEKYLRQVYLTRQNIEKQFDDFLAGEYFGFLVVGDSGTGKTNLLCHLVESRLQTDDIVLFFNCAELSEKDLDLGKLIIERLQGKFGGFGDFIDQLEELRGEREGKLLLVLDALNEHQAPQLVLRSLWEDVLTRIPKMEEKYQWFRVVLSCRTEAWKKLERYFEGGNEFYQTEDGVEVQLTQFTEAELPGVYEKYKEEYKLLSSFDNDLSESTKRFIADPLMLRFVAESYQGQFLPVDPGTIEVLDRYLQGKLHSHTDGDRHISETKIVTRLVELMYAAKSDELVEKELWSDEEIGHFVQAAERVGTPYFRLVDKGILLRIKTEQEVFGAAAMFGGAIEPMVRVRFTYDRFFEYLLAFTIMPHNRTPTTEQIRFFIAEGRETSFPSLWLATSLRLLSTAENEFAVCARLISQLCVDANYGVKGLLEAFLIDYGRLNPDRYELLVANTLLKESSESAGMIAMITAYHLRSINLLEKGFHHPSSMIRQLSIQLIFFLWRKHQQAVDSLIEKLSQDAVSELFRSVPKKFTKKIAGGEDIDITDLYLWNAFSGLAMFFGANLLANAEAPEKFAGMWLTFYSSFPKIFRGQAPMLTKRFIGDALIRGNEANPSDGPINIRTLSIFFRHPVASQERNELRTFAQYITAQRSSINEIGGFLHEMGQRLDGTVSLVVTGALISYIITDPLRSLAMLKDLYDQGNDMSKYNVLRATSVALQSFRLMEEYTLFFDNIVLDLWQNGVPEMEIDGYFYRLGHLGWPMLMECRTKKYGRLEFVDRFLSLRWDSGYASQIQEILRYLIPIGPALSVYPDVSPYPILETVEQWFDFMGDNEQERDDVSSGVAKVLAYCWVAFPDDVESFLDDHPEQRVQMLDALEAESDMLDYRGRESLFNLMSVALLEPQSGASMIEALERICDLATDAEQGLRMIADCLMDVSTLESIRSSLILKERLVTI